MKKLFGHINAVNGQCKCSPFRLQCLLFALTSVFFFLFFCFLKSNVSVSLCLVCLFSSQCSLFSFWQQFYFHTRNWSLKDKTIVGLSGLEKNHRFHLCLRSRKTFLFTAYLMHSLSHCTFTAFASHCTAVMQHLRICRVLGWSLFFVDPRPSPVCPSSLLSAPKLSCHLLPLSFPVYPNLFYSNRLFNQIGARPVEMSTPPQPTPKNTLFSHSSCMEPPG